AMGWLATNATTLTHLTLGDRDSNTPKRGEKVLGLIGERWRASNLRTLEFHIDQLPAEMGDLAWGDALPNLLSLRVSTKVLDLRLAKWISKLPTLTNLAIDLKADNGVVEKAVEAVLRSLPKLRSLRL